MPVVECACTASHQGSLAGGEACNASFGEKRWHSLHSCLGSLTAPPAWPC
ncbi:hypothetical protein [Lysobacter gummosus]